MLYALNSSQADLIAWYLV